jgi:hypothetical protein
MTKVQATFLALVAVQAGHSLEEYAGHLYDVFAPARFVSGLISQDLQRGFLIFNVLLIAFGLWCFYWPVRCHWPSGLALMGFWVTIELVNGVGHPLWTLVQGRYTPGVGTAPVLLVLSVYLGWQLWHASRGKAAA